MAYLIVTSDQKGYDRVRARTVVRKAWHITHSFQLLRGWWLAFMITLKVNVDTLIQTQIISNIRSTVKTSFEFPNISRRP